LLHRNPCADVDRDDANPLQRISRTRSRRSPMMKLESSRGLLFDNSYQSTTCARPRAPFPRTKPIASAARAPRTKPISSSSNEADNRITKRSQWHDRGNGSRKPARSLPNRFSQTNPLTRYDVLNSEKCRCSGRGAFPERSQSRRSVDSREDPTADEEKASGSKDGSKRFNRR
jgi:hypothetical protein